MSEDQPGARPSVLGRYATRDAVVYHALILPALIAEVVFSTAILSTPGDLVQSNVGPVAAVAEVLPWVLLLGSAYAVLAFRPSLLVAFLIASFFIAASVANGITFLGAQLNLGDTVILVVAATFLALAGFNYSRGLRLSKGRKPEVQSGGPVAYNAFAVGLETAVPLIAAFALVLLVEALVSAIGVQARALPQPLSSLVTLYLATRIGLVFTTLFVAGATIWVLRQFLEPIILSFTLTRDDAKKELLGEIEPTTKRLIKFASYKPSRGLSWWFLTSGYCVAIFVVLTLLVPRADFLRDLSSVFTLHAPSPSSFELLLETAFQNALVKADILFAQSQDYIRDIIRLLWG